MIESWSNYYVFIYRCSWILTNKCVFMNLLGLKLRLLLPEVSSFLGPVWQLIPERQPLVSPPRHKSRKIWFSWLPSLCSRPIWILRTCSGTCRSPPLQFHYPDLCNSSHTIYRPCESTTVSFKLKRSINGREKTRPQSRIPVRWKRMRHFLPWKVETN